MTQLYLHPAIEDYFVEYDFDEVRRSPADGGPDDLRRRIMQDYAAEKCILLRGVKVDYDRRFIDAVPFPPTWFYKKFPTRVVEADKPLSRSAGKQEICRDLFGGDAGKFAKLQTEVRAVNTALRSALDEILRHHKVSADDITWRHTETRVENLHFDIDKDAATFESVRLYLNMDDIPRIWRLSHPLSHILDAFYDELDLGQTAAEPLERLLQILSLRLFGNWASRGREQFPCHTALFEPGDIWICDGRTVPHQVIYGRRVASSFYRLDSDALPAWHPSLASKVRQVHAARSAGAPATASARDMRGYAYPFKSGGPKPPPGVTHPDLKENWDRLYEDSIQPKLVRL
jgi:hypothetical protein